ncbi:MAG TPA: NADH-quinone oxidoreductase subunit J [Candidatus Nanopelagicaceae bacterium]|nr:NADH-quinone oxidoreductase subunit J [Candidatus Nanopelagicaceae bacterium]
MTVIFGIAAVLAFLGAVGVVLSQRTLYSALSLVLNMVALAVLFLLLDAQFVAAVQIIVYAGAVMVLFVFIIALLSPGAEERVRPLELRMLFGGGLAAVFTVVIGRLALNGITVTSNGHFHGVLGPFSPNLVDSHGQVQTLGEQLFTTYLLPFEVTSLLLLVAAVGAVYLSKHRRVSP